MGQVGDQVVQENPDAANAVIVSTITARYGDEALASMLVAAKEAPTTRNLAAQLEEVQLANWLTSKKTADDVFKLLKLDDEGAKLFDTPVFSTWVSYASKLDEKNPDALMFSVLKARYDDDALADIFIAAKETRGAQSIAARQESILFTKWVSDAITADDAFKLLNLNPKTDDFLKRPALDSWISYVKMLGEDPYKLLLATVSARYTDEGLARMLVVAKQDHITASVAAKLEHALFNRWLSQGKSAESVFKLLNLKKEENKLFESPMFSTWESYVTKLDKTNHDKLMLSVLKTGYNDESLANMLISAQKLPRTKPFAGRLQKELWISQDKTADDIFQLLKLDQQGENIFDTGEFSTWVSYVTKLNKLDEKPDEFAVIIKLQKRFGNLELAKMFSAELKSSGPNKNLISSLQALQFKRWLADGITPNKLDTMLAPRTLNLPGVAPIPLSDFDNRSTGVLLNFEDFYRANA
ncbi:hypothetical protein PF005_g27918 [Phytophthora fragariae]|uniref:RxLR effector PexRD54 WY domain-containing protein n=2 Tax=Phytophthora fragariae TaxID=53985 RepID=A0A6A3VPM1_9STRA|nr:hypothetical protein PF005_g27918 [Phytophthora fragariae]KAE9173868.1 hypothetical protein PF002_g29207 [Phytophthora fragariae]KAE9273584.1 hypothetical protein PF001_g27442 [Phytophthora fragariae]